MCPINIPGLEDTNLKVEKHRLTGGETHQELFSRPVNLASSAPTGEVVPGVHLGPGLQVALQESPAVNIQNLLTLKYFMGN